MASVFRIHPDVFKRLLERYKKDSGGKAKSTKSKIKNTVQKSTEEGVEPRVNLRSVDIAWGLGLVTLSNVDTQRELFKKLLRVRRGCDPVTGRCPPSATDTGKQQGAGERGEQQLDDEGKVFTLSSVPGVFPASFAHRDLVKHTFSRQVDSQTTVAQIVGDIVAFGSLLNMALLKTMVDLASKKAPKVKNLDQRFLNVARYLRGSDLALFLEDENISKSIKSNKKQWTEHKDNLIKQWRPVLRQLDRDIKVRVGNQELGVVTAAQLLFLDTQQNKHFANVFHTLAQHISQRVVERSQDTDFMRRYGEFFSISAGLIHKVNDRHIMYTGTVFDVGAPKVDLGELYFEGILDHMSRQGNKTRELLTNSENWFKERVLLDNQTSLNVNTLYEKHNQLFARGKTLLPPGVLVGHPMRSYPAVLSMLEDVLNNPEHKDLEETFQLLLDQNRVRESMALNALWYHIISGEHTQFAKSVALRDLLNTIGDRIHEVFVPDGDKRERDKVNVANWVRSLDGTRTNFEVNNDRNIGEAIHELFSNEDVTNYISRSVKSRPKSLDQALSETHRDAAYLSTVNPLHAIHGVALGLTSTNTKPDVNVFFGNLSFLPFVLSKGDILGLPTPFNTASYGNQSEQLSRIQGLVELSKIVAQGIRTAFSNVSGNKQKLYRKLMKELNNQFLEPSLTNKDSYLVPKKITSEQEELSQILSDIHTVFENSWLAKLATNETQELVMRGLNYMLLYLGHIHQQLNGVLKNKQKKLRSGVWSYRDPNLHVRLVSSFLLGNHQFAGDLGLSDLSKEANQWYKVKEESTKQLPPLMQKSADQVFGVLYKLGKLYNTLGDIQNTIMRAFKFNLGGKKVYLQNLHDITKYIANTGSIGNDPKSVALRQAYEKMIQDFQRSVQKAILEDFSNLANVGFSQDARFNNLEKVLILISNLLSLRFSRKELSNSKYNQFDLEKLSASAGEFVESLITFAVDKNVKAKQVRKKMDELSEQINQFVTKEGETEQLNLAEIKEIHKAMENFNARTASEVAQNLNELTTNLEHIRLLPGTLTIGKKTGLYAANILGHEYYRTIDRWMKYFSGSPRFTKPKQGLHSDYDVSTIMGFVEGDVVNKVSPLTPILGALFATFEEELDKQTTQNVVNNMEQVQQALNEFAQRKSTRIALRLWLFSLLHENPQSFIATKMHEYKMSEREQREVNKLIQSLDETMEIYKNLNEIKSNNDLYKTIQRSVFEVIRPVFDYKEQDTLEKRQQNSTEYIVNSLYKILGYSYKAMNVVKDMAEDHGLPHLSLIDFLAASSSQALMWFSLRDTWDNIDPTAFSYKVADWDPKKVHELIDKKITTHGASEKRAEPFTANVFPEWAQNITFHDIWDTLTEGAKSAIVERFGEEVRGQPNPLSAKQVSYKQDSRPDENLIIEHNNRVYKLNTKTKEGQTLLASLTSLFWFSDRGIFGPQVRKVVEEKDTTTNKQYTEELERIKNRYRYNQHSRRFGTYRLGTKMIDLSPSSVTGAYSLASTLNYLDTMLPKSVRYGTGSRVYHSSIIPYKHLSDNDLMHMSTTYSAHSSLTTPVNKPANTQTPQPQQDTMVLQVV